MADVMPRFRLEVLLKQLASLQGACAGSSGLRSQRHSGTGVVGGLGRKGLACQMGSASGSPAEGPPQGQLRLGHGLLTTQAQEPATMKAPAISLRNPSTVQVVSHPRSLVTPMYLM